MDADRALSRTRDDRCPGALAPHAAADGMLCRIRLPGGELAPVSLAGLADLSERFGDGVLELTSRGNIQIRAVAPADLAMVAERIADLGLLPTATHERVRNIVASPLAGLDGWGPRLTPIVRELDRRLCGRPALAGLPARFLFALDDGRGDMVGMGPDAAAVALNGARWRVLPVDVEVASAEVVRLLLATADAFLAERSAQSSSAWRVAELPGGPESVGARVRRDLSLSATGSRRRRVPADDPDDAIPAEPVGPIRQPDRRWTVVVLAPLGRLSANQARLLARHAGGEAVRITPWRSVVVPDLSAAAPLLAAAAEAGLGVAADSPWYGISACTGRPGCAEALADVRADAAAAVRSGERQPPGTLAHWSGCARRCGRPTRPYMDVVATADGYEISESA